MWIYPYNGQKKNPIKTKNPEAFLIFSEIIDEAQFPDGAKNDGNSEEILGERIGGDMDDWVLSELNIPSITNELGTQDQYSDEKWLVKSKEDAMKICSDNSQWLDFVYEKLGVQMAIQPLFFERKGENVTVTMQVSNLGLSNMNDTVTAKAPQASSGKSFAKRASGVHRLEASLTMTPSNDQSLVQTSTAQYKNLLGLVSMHDSNDNLPNDATKLNLAARESKQITLTGKFDKDLIGRSIVDSADGDVFKMNFKFRQFAADIVPGKEPADLLLEFKTKSHN